MRLPARETVLVIAGLGVAVDAALFVARAPAPFGWRLQLFALWMLLPWLAVLVLGWRRTVLRGLVLAAVLAAAFEALAFVATFVHPRGSTAGLVYAIKPIWQLGLVGAVVLLAGGPHARKPAAGGPPRG